VHPSGIAMSNAASIIASDFDFSMDSCLDSPAADPADDAFRGPILAAMRDLRARERRASCPDLRLGDAANDDASAPPL
jgi:hypothetical protein